MLSYGKVRFLVKLFKMLMENKNPLKRPITLQQLANKNVVQFSVIYSFFHTW